MEALDKFLEKKYIIVPIAFAIWLVAGIVLLFYGINSFRLSDLFWLPIFAILFYKKEDRTKLRETYGLRG